MLPDLSSIFTEYEALQARTDALFESVRQSVEGCVRCRPGCSDCCHALFDLGLAEAMYLNQAFRKSFPQGPERSTILDRAADTDRHLARFKHDLFLAEKNGDKTRALMDRAARQRVRCPLLSDEDKCLLYAARPITCRLYGIPACSAGQTYVCGFSGFTPGGKYPTVFMDKIQQSLSQLSKKIADTLRSRYSELHEIYLPVSMALTLDFDEDWLGMTSGATEK